MRRAAFTTGPHAEQSAGLREDGSNSDVAVLRERASTLTIREMRFDVDFGAGRAEGEADMLRLTSKCSKRSIQSGLYLCVPTRGFATLTCADAGSCCRGQ
eukprot:6200423-Pleurochrysis_carterae.AAC.2